MMRSPFPGPVVSSSRLPGAATPKQRPLVPAGTNLGPQGGVDEDAPKCDIVTLLMAGPRTRSKPASRASSVHIHAPVNMTVPEHQMPQINWRWNRETVRGQRYSSVKLCRGGGQLVAHSSEFP